MSINNFNKIINTGCIIRRIFHIYCPGCGGTRAVRALIRFDFGQSLYYNPTVILLFLYFLILIVTRIIEIIFPEKPKNYRVKIIAGEALIAFIICYAILRNYLLIFKGIDMLGDFR